MAPLKNKADDVYLFLRLLKIFYPSLFLISIEISSTTSDT